MLQELRRMKFHENRVFELHQNLKRLENSSSYWRRESLTFQAFSQENKENS